MVDADRKGCSREQRRVLIGSPQYPQTEGEVTPGNLHLFHRYLVVTFFLKLKYSIPEMGIRILDCNKCQGYARPSRERICHALDAQTVLVKSQSDHGPSAYRVRVISQTHISVVLVSVSFRVSGWRLRKPNQCFFRAEELPGVLGCSLHWGSGSPDPLDPVSLSPEALSLG